ncbi:MAG: glycosyltransferase family 4 protein [Gemmatimonadetes bacterium]|nr:glycosyltransferase family 4 protein [Gemmatimonadota bacterium]
MRLAYVCADSGIPIESTKGAAVHVRSLSRELALASGNLLLVGHMRKKSDSDNGGPAAMWGTRQLPLRVVTIREEMVGRPVPPPSGDCRVEKRLLENEVVHDVLRHEHDSEAFDGVYERYSLWSAGAAEFCRRNGVPHVLEVNAPLAWEEARYRNLAVPHAALFHERAIFQAADHIVAVSNEVAAHVTSLGVDEDRVHVQPNGFDRALFTERTSPSQPRPQSLPEKREGDFWIVFVGSLKPWHGVEVLLEAFASLARKDSSCRLLLVGKGPMADLVRDRFAPECESGAIVLTGACRHEEIPRILSFADIGVAPYPRLDHFYFSPLKIIEYAAAGLPFVASRTGQVKDLFRSGESAWLVEPGDAAALEAGIEHLRSNRSLRSKIAAGARQVVKPLSWDRNADRMIRLMLTEPSRRLSTQGT